MHISRIEARLLLVASVLAVAAGAWWFAGRPGISHNAAAQAVAVNTGMPPGYTQTPRAMTAAECARYGPMIDAMVRAVQRQIAQQSPALQAGFAAKLQAAAARSHGWASAGCPPDVVLGIYPATDGSGNYASRLLDWPPAVASSSASWSGHD